MLPNGMFGHLFGPHKGYQNDAFMFTESGILDLCHEFAVHEGTNKDTPNKECYFQLFGNPAYGVSAQIQSPFAGAGDCTEEQKQ